MAVALIEWQAHRTRSHVADGEVGEPEPRAALPVAVIQDERAAQARAERSEAFKDLWKIVQEAHIGVRNDFDRTDELSEVHRRLNVLLIEKAPALERSDVERAHNFLTALGDFIRLLRPLPGAAAEQIRRDMADTMEGLPLRRISVLKESYDRMLDCSAALEKRYREVVFGEH